MPSWAATSFAIPGLARPENTMSCFLGRLRMFAEGGRAWLTGRPPPRCRPLVRDAGWPRTNASGWGASGTLYLVGGSDGTTSRPEAYWAVPNSVGNIPEWKRLDVSDLPAPGLEGAAPLLTGPNVILIGGTSTGPEGSQVLASSVRSSLAPQAPFFQLGIAGATVPALKIEGEIGQQLGYLAAAGVGTVNFIILLIIGWAFAHRSRAARSSTASSSGAAAGSGAG